MIKTKHVLYTYDGKAWHMINFKSGKNYKVLVQQNCVKSMHG